MIRLMMALACTMAFTQYAEAAAMMATKKRDTRELAAIRNQDPNLPGTKAWQKDQVERKASCDVARHQGDRHANTGAAKVAEAVSQSSDNMRTTR